MALTTIDDRGLKTPIDLLDNEKIRFGTTNDFEIYQDGDHAFLSNNSNDFLIQNGSGNNNNQIRIRAQHGEESIVANGNGSVDIYYDGTKRLATDSQSINILGDEGESCHVYIYADEGDDGADCWRLKSDHTASSFYLQNYAGGDWDDTNIKANGGGSVELYHAGTKTFETTSAGATIHRDLTLNHASGDTALRWAVGGTNKFSIYESSGTLRLYDNTNSAERMRIASNGKIGINVDSPTRLLHVKDTAGGDAQIIVETTANAERAQIEFKSPHGTWVTGTFGGNTTGDWLTYTAGDHDAIFYQNGGEKFRIKGDGDVEIKDGNLIIETAGHGINFHPHSGTANLLDDYEEGTWSPTVFGSTTAGSYSLEAARTGGKYTKIGNLVYIEGVLRITSITSAGAGTLKFGGLPFGFGSNPASSWNEGTGIQITHYAAGSNSTVSDYPPPFIAIGPPSATTFSVYSYGKNYAVDTDITDLSAAGWIYQIAGCYQV